jgi:hypothetical protein
VDDRDLEPVPGEALGGPQPGDDHQIEAVAAGGRRPGAGQRSGPQGGVVQVGVVVDHHRPARQPVEAQRVGRPEIPVLAEHDHRVEGTERPHRLGVDREFGQNELGLEPLDQRVHEGGLASLPVGLLVDDRHTPARSSVPAGGVGGHRRAHALARRGAGGDRCVRTAVLTGPAPGRRR